MKPTPGPRRRQQHKHRQHTPADDGWTHVSYAPTRAAAAARALFRSHAVAAPGPRLYTLDKTLTPARLAGDYAACQAKWRATACRRTLVAALQGRQQTPVDTAVCLALGAVAREGLHWRTLWQLACFVDLAEQLGRGRKVRMLVQEPSLLPPDRPFLASIGVDVLSGDAAALELFGPSTMAFVPFLEKKAEAPYLARAGECALYVSTAAGEAVEHFQAYQGEGGEISEAIKGAQGLRKTHRELHFPECEGDGQALMGLWMYVKQEDED